MTILWINFNGVKAYLVGGDLTVVHGFTGSPNPAFGIPQDALDFEARTQCGLAEMTGQEWQQLLTRNGII